MTGNLHGNITRVDLVFDQYLKNSIKGGTRAKLQKIHTIVSNDVKMPANWNSLIEMDEK